jgi:hypothetical protein
MTQSHATAQLPTSTGREIFQASLGAVIVAPRNGLQLPQRLSFENWLNIGKQLSAISTSSAWCLGDWLAYGIEAFSGRYRSAVEETSLDYQTLRNYVWVAKRFPLSRRRDTLSFGHHAEVAALAEPEQDFWLRKAEEFGWPMKQLRREVRASLREREPGSESSPGESEYLDIRINPDQLKTCQRAATNAGLDVEEWIVMTLTKVARDMLGT